MAPGRSGWRGRRRCRPPRLPATVPAPGDVLHGGRVPPAPRRPVRASRQLRRSRAPRPARPAPRRIPRRPLRAPGCAGSTASSPECSPTDCAWRPSDRCAGPVTRHVTRCHVRQGDRPAGNHCWPWARPAPVRQGRTGRIGDVLSTSRRPEALQPCGSGRPVGRDVGARESVSVSSILKHVGVKQLLKNQLLRSVRLLLGGECRTPGADHLTDSRILLKSSESTAS